MHEEHIVKIGALIFNQQGGLLAVHKRGKPKFELIVPGGKKEKNETDEQTLRREILEELDATVKTFSYVTVFEDQAIYEKVWLKMRVYHVILNGSPRPSGEIDKLIWLDQHYKIRGYQFASILGKKILPMIFDKNKTA